LQWRRPAGSANNIEACAKVSPCRNYRYVLGRRFVGTELPLVCVIGVNPSTADGFTDDATVRKLIGFCRVNDWGGFYLVNLFSYRSTDQVGLLLADASSEHVWGAAGPSDGSVGWLQWAMEDHQVICAWGSGKTAPVRRLIAERRRTLRHTFEQQQLWCWGRSADGSPRHPLMLSYKTPLQLWVGT
jgi:hypothetical protein